MIELLILKFTLFNNKKFNNGQMNSIKAVENIINNSHAYHLIYKNFFIMLIFEKLYYEKF